MTAPRWAHGEDVTGRPLTGPAGPPEPNAVQGVLGAAVGRGLPAGEGVSAVRRMVLGRRPPRAPVVSRLSGRRPPRGVRCPGGEDAQGIDAFHLAEVLLTQPLLMVGCDTHGAFGSHRGAYEIFNRAASEKKELFVVPGSTHYSLYDQPKYVDQAFERGLPPSSRTTSGERERERQRRGRPGPSARTAGRMTGLAEPPCSGRSAGGEPAASQAGRVEVSRLRRGRDGGCHRGRRHADCGRSRLRAAW